MKVFYNNSFIGHYPVGTSALVVAGNATEAAFYLEDSLLDHGLEQLIKPDDMLELSLERGTVLIVQDGDY